MTRRVGQRGGRTLPATTRLCAALLLASLTIAGSACSTDDTGGEVGGLMGVFVGFNEYERLLEFEDELGAPVDLVVTMADSRAPDAMVSSVWGQFVGPDAYLPEVSDRLQVVASIPVAFGPGGLARTEAGRVDVGEGLRDVAEGRFDNEFRVVGRYLVEAGYGDAIIRLGHEFDGDWAPYSSRGNADAYVSAFRHVHDVLSTESPDFRFDWTSTVADFREYGPAAYPGDDVVDFIGLDLYWRAAEPIGDDTWSSRFEPTLQSHLDFAQVRNKPVSYPEWGRAHVDEPGFVTLMHRWFSRLPATGPGRLGYQAYFNEVGLRDDQFYPYDLDQLPAVERRYVELFGPE